MTGSSDRSVWTAHLAVPSVLLLVQFVLPPFHQGMFSRIMVLSAYAIGYNLLFGYTGLMSLGHAMFFATGMYATGLVVFYLRWSLLPAVLTGLAASAAMPLLLGVVALRTRGMAFLIVTMMFSQAFFLSTLTFNRITGGDQGLALTGRIPPLHLGPWQAALATPAVKYNVAFLVFVAAFVVSLWLVRSPAGHVWVAIRENEERAQLLGYDPFRYKLLALTLSGTLAGMAGATYALLFSYLGSSFASISYSIFPLLWTLVGGVGTVIGPLIGTTLMTYAVDTTSGFTDAYLIAVGMILVILIIWFPQGIGGAVRARWWRWLP